MWNREITLLKKQVNNTDELGQPVVTFERNTILAQEVSITNAMMFYASQFGYKPTFVIRIHAFEYQKESLLECEGVRYSIKRVFRYQEGELMELQCEEVTGDKNEFGFS